jgi:hypothetical protein
MTDSSKCGPDPATHESVLADRLRAGRPVPAAGFRGALGRHLAIEDPGYGPRPRRLRLVASGYIAGGSVLLVAGLLHATGML